jgi:hypothetical protein
MRGLIGSSLGGVARLHEETTGTGGKRSIPRAEDAPENLPVAPRRERALKPRKAMLGSLSTGETFTIEGVRGVVLAKGLWLWGELHHAAFVPGVRGVDPDNPRPEAMRPRRKVYRAGVLVGYERGRIILSTVQDVVIQ